MYVETIEPLVSICTKNELFYVQEKGNMLTISERKNFSLKPQNKVDLWNEIIHLLDSEPMWLTMPYFEDLVEPGDCRGEVFLKTTCQRLSMPELVSREGKNYIKGVVKLDLNKNFTRLVDEASRFRFLFEDKDICGWAFNPEDTWEEDRVKSTYTLTYIPIIGIKKIQLKIEPY